MVGYNPYQYSVIWSNLHGWYSQVRSCGKWHMSFLSKFICKFGSDFGVTSLGSFLCKSYQTCINKKKASYPLHECNYICIPYSARLAQISKSSLTAPFILRDHTEMDIIEPIQRLHRKAYFKKSHKHTWQQ